MTKEQCREAGATMIAWADGKSIQYRRRNQSEWFDIEPACTATTLSWDWDEFEYRVKPMPKLRPWTADEVPARACRIIERELNAANERIKRLEKLLLIVSKGPRREYKNGPEEYFAALKETWRLLEEKQP